MRKLTRKEEWYFIKQDINSYLMSTLWYVFLCLIKDFSLTTVICAIFDCLVYYVPFWFIRINFKDTYHSDSWKHCKMWTRIMLFSGVTILWMLPIKHSLFNGLFVAFACCLILYLVALEVNEKKRLRKENEELHKQIVELVSKYETPERKILTICEELFISKRDTQIAVMYYIDRLKPMQIWEWLSNNNQNMELNSVYKLLNRLNHKILPELNKN